MKFIEASEFGGPEVLTLVEAPTPTPTEGTLLVEIRAAGVNYADIMARSGFYPQVPKAPFAVGFEIAGVVKGIGKGVEVSKMAILLRPSHKVADMLLMPWSRPRRRSLFLPDSSCAFRRGARSRCYCRHPAR
jgi:NADPH:quinone reductase-like Zn-dependent oxidoreductase